MLIQKNQPTTTSQTHHTETCTKLLLVLAGYAAYVGFAFLFWYL